MDKILPFHLSDLTSTSVWGDTSLLVSARSPMDSSRPLAQCFLHYCGPSAAVARARRCLLPASSPWWENACMHFSHRVSWTSAPRIGKQKTSRQMPCNLYEEYPKTRTEREKKQQTKINKWTKKKKTQTTQTSDQTKTQPTSTKTEKKQEPVLVFSLLERGICYSLQREWCFDPRQALMPVILIQNANICFIHSGLTPWGKRGAKKQGRRSPQDDCFS